MEQVYLLNYSVKGVKTLDELISLSFYKKTITSKMDTQDYNVKGIYGMNGSGKSGIVNSVEILRNLLVDAGYLSNPIVQQNLNSIINKKTESLFIEVDYVVKLKGGIQYFKYNVTLSKDISREKYIISQEKLLTKNALSKSNRMSLIFDVVDGQIKHLIDEEEEFSRRFLNKTVPFQVLVNNKEYMMVRCGVYIRNYIESEIKELKWEQRIHKVDRAFNQQYKFKLGKFEIENRICDYGAFIFSCVALCSYIVYNVQIKNNVVIFLTEFSKWGIVISFIATIVAYKLCYKGSNYDYLSDTFESIMDGENL